MYDFEEEKKVIQFSWDHSFEKQSDPKKYIYLSTFDEIELEFWDQV